MSDPYLLRDGEGNPLSSIFHKPPCKEWVPKSMRIHSDEYWNDINRELLKLFDLNFTITEFHPDDYKEAEK